MCCRSHAPAEQSSIAIAPSFADRRYRCRGRTQITRLGYDPWAWRARRGSAPCRRECSNRRPSWPRSALLDPTLDLIRSLDSEHDADAAEAWGDEIERRAAEVEAGAAETMTLDECRATFEPDARHAPGDECPVSRLVVAEINHEVDGVRAMVRRSPKPLPQPLRHGNTGAIALLLCSPAGWLAFSPQIIQIARHARGPIAQW